MRSKTLLKASLVLGLSTASPVSKRQDASAEPCAQIAGLVAAAKAADPTAAYTEIEAAPAWACIQSVPLNATAARALLKSVRPFVRWQSTTANLKSPPAEYVEKVQAPHDVWAALDDIEDKLNTGAWTKEYDFGYALYKAFQTSHDGHFWYQPDVLGKVFRWGRKMALVSISEDGEKIPAPFAYNDILATSHGQADWEPSALKTINGQDATDFLENLSQIGFGQDRDALYNNVFYSLPQISMSTTGAGTGIFGGGGRGRLEYTGPTTEIEFVNGTSITLINTATVFVDFDGINSGADVYEKYFLTGDLTIPLGQISLNSTAESYRPARMTPATDQAKAQTASIPAPGYPAPIFRGSLNSIGGYYIDAAGYEDVAVLSVPSFVGDEADSETEFQSIGEQFLAAAQAAGKKKLIIDVSANGGGTILQGYDLFKQLFPALEPYAAADRIRAFESTRLIGNVESLVSGQYQRTMSDPDDIQGIETDVCNYRSDLVADTDKHFTSWDDKFGPEEHQGDHFIKRFRWDLNDPLILNLGGIPIHGYGNLSTYSSQPFAAEDIVIVYDGYCASTCTIFSELMRQLAGVEAVAMGGRPTTDQIQAVGGVKGTNDLEWPYVQQIVENAFRYATPAQREEMLNSELAEHNSYLPFYRGIGNGAINFRDGIRKGDEENIPLQFRYEEADCRLFYEAEMMLDMTAMWKKVADAKWKGADCVAGGLAESGEDEEERKKKKKKTKKRAARAVSTIAPMKNIDIPLAQVGQLRESLNVRTDPSYNRRVDGYVYP